MRRPWPALGRSATEKNVSSTLEFRLNSSGSSQGGWRAEGVVGEIMQLPFA
jgi:hypothetical protein